MNIKQKKVLYESIMKNVSKTVKHSLNESLSEIIIVAEIDNDRSFLGPINAYYSDEEACNKFRELVSEYTTDEDEIESALDDGYYDSTDTTILIDTCVLH